MPNKFSTKSLNRVFTCHPDLQKVFREVIKYYDCSILDGRRNKLVQDKYFEEGKSKKRYPDSKHNKDPSRAIDVAPYPIDWKDTKRFYYFAGLVMGVANVLYKEGKIFHMIRWGGNWDQDEDLNDQSFMDLCHFELI